MNCFRNRLFTTACEIKGFRPEATTVAISKVTYNTTSDAFIGFTILS